LKYQRIEQTDGTIRYRCQPRDPITKKRLNIEASTLEELRERLKRIEQTREGLRYGMLDQRQAIDALRTVQRRGPFTVAGLWERYVKTLSETSANLARGNWENRLKQYFGALSPHELTRDKMAAWERDLQKRGFAPKTIGNAYNHLAGCMRIAIDAREIDELPWGAVSRHYGGSGWRPAKAEARKQRQAVGTLEQALQLLDTAKKADERSWAYGKYSAYATTVAFLMLTGLRQAEACAVGWDCVDIDQPLASELVKGAAANVLRVLWQAKRKWWTRSSDRPRDPLKTKRPRSQVLHDTLVQILRMHRAELRRRGWFRFDGPLFPGRKGEWRRSAKVMLPTKMKDFAADAGFPFPEDWVVHSMRHSFATLEIKASGGDLKRTQARTGHADVRQLEGYLHATGEFLGHSAIPLLPMRTEQVHRLPDGTEFVNADPWGIEVLEKPPPVEHLTERMARAYDKEVVLANRELREQSERPFIEIATEWLQNPARSRSGYPPAVEEAAKRAYHRAYSQEKRAGGKPKQCQQAGARKRRATLGAWARALSIAERKVSAEVDK
jgi:integrase